MKTFTVPANRTIVLPKHLFKPSERIVLMTEGNALIIKKLEPPKLSAIATRAKGRALPMREIAREVHAFRQAKRAE